MIVAMLSTKISLYLGTSPLPLPAAPPQIGFWAVLHEIRSDYAQIMVALYLLINGPGKWSMDALLDKLRTSKNAVISLQKLLSSNAANQCAPANCWPGSNR
jgi:hypothetical protein